MLQFLKEEANRTLTENGAVTNRSTGSDVLDFFATAGALRSSSECEIVDRFKKAFADDRDLAMKALFYTRDVRGGLGERKVFRAILPWLGSNETAAISKNVQYIPEYGRFDDLFSLFGTPAEGVAFEVIKSVLNSDIQAMKSGSGEITLLGKWLPSINASSKETVNRAKKLARMLNMTDAKYRKMLSALRKAIQIIENNLRTKDYTFDYSKQPSKAMLKYQKAFIRNDGRRYSEFLEAVHSGEKTVHTGTLTPYDIVGSIMKSPRMDEEERRAKDTTWQALEDFTRGENAICVVDGSGSMYWNWSNPMPAAVAQSLGIYFAERCEGAFHNHFITFSMTPQLVEIKGRDIFEKVKYCEGFDECANTNIEAVFQLILNAAVKNSVPQDELPSTIYIISDMEFDSCAKNSNLTNFENAKQMFQQAGYRLPMVVFWNVQSRNEQQPVKMDDSGAILVSGCSARTFSMVMSGDLNPYSFMLKVLGAERYAKISA